MGIYFPCVFLYHLSWPIFSALANTQGINLLSKYDKLVLVVFLKTRNQEFRSNDG